MKSPYVNGVYRTRMRILAGILCICLLGLAIRTAYIEIVNSDYLEMLADSIDFTKFK